MAQNELFMEAGTHLVINTVQRQLFHYQGDNTPRIYPVAVGKTSTPTPTGRYQIVNKQINPGGVLGSRWMGLNIPGGIYGIHGTNNPDSISKAISNGCIRMHNHHIETVFPQVNIGTPVIIQTPEGGGTVSSGKNGGKTYTVQPGDTLWSISRRLGVPLESIIQANPRISPNQIYPGQTIYIPG